MFETVIVYACGSYYGIWWDEKKKGEDIKVFAWVQGSKCQKKKTKETKKTKTKTKTKVVAINGKGY